MNEMVDGFEKVVEVSDVPVGTTKNVKFMGQEVAIANVGGKLTGYVVQCPWHGSKFDVRTGAVVGPRPRLR